jgi:hypothetical protein
MPHSRAMKRAVFTLSPASTRAHGCTAEALVAALPLRKGGAKQGGTQSCWAQQAASFAVLFPNSYPPAHPHARTPVTMRTVMPARWQRATAAGTSGLTGSLMPTTA